MAEPASPSSPVASTLLPSITCARVRTAGVRCVRHSLRAMPTSTSAFFDLGAVQMSKWPRGHVDMAAGQGAPVAPRAPSHHAPSRPPRAPPATTLLSQ